MYLINLIVYIFFPIGVAVLLSRIDYLFPHYFFLFYCPYIYYRAYKADKDRLDKEANLLLFIIWYLVLTVLWIPLEMR